MFASGHLGLATTTSTKRRSRCKYPIKYGCLHQQVCYERRLWVAILTRDRPLVGTSLSVYSAAHASKLSPIFHHRLSTKTDWSAHYTILIWFWESLLLGTQTYRGKTVTVHRQLGPLSKRLFICWLTLIAATVDELFAGPARHRIKHLARRAGASIMKRTRDNVESQPRYRASP